MKLIASETEARLAAIWSDLLCVDDIGADDNFFALGGDSLAAADMVAIANRTFGRSDSVFNLFDHPTLARYAAYADSSAPPAPQAQTSDDSVTLPLSRAQRWLLDAASADPALNNLVLHVDLAGAVDAATIESAVSALMARHELLRGRLHDGGVRIGEIPRPAVTPCDADAFDATHQSLFGRLLSPDTPLFEVVHAHDGGAHRLLLYVHHAVADRESLDTIVHDLVALCEGRPLAPATSYRRYLDADAPGAESNAAPPLVQFARAAAGPEALHAAATIDPETTAALRRLAAENETTLFTVLLASFALALQRLVRQETFGIGVILSRREQFPGLVGPTGVPVVLPVADRRLQTFDDALRSAMAKLGAAWRSAGGGAVPPFNVFFDYEKHEPIRRPASAIEVVEHPMRTTGRMLRDLSVRAVDHGAHISLNIRHRANILEPDALTRAFADVVAEGVA